MRTRPFCNCSGSTSLMSIVDQKKKSKSINNNVTNVTFNYKSSFNRGLLTIIPNVSSMPCFSKFDTSAIFG